MLTLESRPARLCDGFSRRELLRVGGLSLMGLSLPQLLAARETAPLGVLPTDKTFGRAKNVIFLFLAGGPPQHETFDPKPDAPVEIRGAFKPISTNVPGIQFCELLPRIARMADKLAVVRSLSTNDSVHSSSGSWVLSGYKYQGPNARTIQPTDWPYFGSIIKRYKPSEVLPPLSTVWIPDIWRLNESVTPAGQTGGFMGREWDPDRIVGDPSQPDYEVEGLRLSDLPPLRLKQRETLLSQVNSHFASAERGKDVAVFNQLQQQAFGLLTSGRARQAFAIAQEPDKVRDRYGRNPWGQCVLLARRLIESGVRLVNVTWPRMPGDNAVDNPLWDTHAQNADRLEDVLCPQFDVGFSALIEDLDERGLLDETLVVAVGEFGRTPKINAKGGRDHWGPVFNLALAGAGVSGGQVYGASDKQGAYPAENRVEPGDMTATIFHLLGIPHQGTFQDREGREHRLTEGKPLFELLGTEPATLDRVEAGGEIARVPPYQDILLLNTAFTDPVPLYELGTARPKGWRAAPLLADGDDGFGVRNVDGSLRIGFGLAGGDGKVQIDEKATAVVAQEVRSPFAGTFKLTAQLRGEGSSKEFYESVFLRHFRMKLVLFEFTEAAKTPEGRKELASIELKPAFAVSKSEEFEQAVLEKVFVNPSPGSNFSFGLGLGVAIIVEKVTADPLHLPSGAPRQAFLRIERIDLKFTGKPRNDNVKV